MGITCSIDNVVLPNVTSCSDLEITVTNDLSAGDHVIDIVVRAHRWVR